MTTKKDKKANWINIKHVEYEKKFMKMKITEYIEFWGNWITKTFKNDKNT